MITLLAPWFMLSVVSSRSFVRKIFTLFNADYLYVMKGAASLAAAYIAGPRMDRFDSEGKINHIPQHSVPVLHRLKRLYR